MKDKLREYSISSQLATEILDDVFGKKLGSVYIKGLVDSIDTADFDEKEKMLFVKWRNSEHTSESNIEGFIDWFHRFKSPVVRESMISAVREECGLGSPPMPFIHDYSCRNCNYLTLSTQVNHAAADGSITSIAAVVDCTSHCQCY